MTLPVPLGISAPVLVSRGQRSRCPPAASSSLTVEVAGARASRSRLPTARA